MTRDDEALLEARRLVAEALARAPGDIPPDGSIHSIPAWDSLGHVRVVLAVEAAIGRPLSSDAIAALGTVEDVAVILADKAGGG